MAAFRKLAFASGVAASLGRYDFSEEDKRLANDSKASYLILSLMEEGNPVLNAFHVEGEQGSRTVRKEELVILENE